MGMLDVTTCIYDVFFINLTLFWLCLMKAFPVLCHIRAVHIVHLMCCCPSLLVGTTNTTILLEYLKFKSLMHYVHCRQINQC